MQAGELGITNSANGAGHATNRAGGYATKRLGRQELDLGVLVADLHKTRRVHLARASARHSVAHADLYGAPASSRGLHPLQIDGLRVDTLAHLDAVTSAMLTSPKTTGDSSTERSRAFTAHGH